MAQNTKRDAKINDNSNDVDVNINPHLGVSHLEKKERPVSANLENSRERIARP